jgi:hypothetical protein
MTVFKFTTREEIEKRKKKAKRPKPIWKSMGINKKHKPRKGQANWRGHSED